MAKRAIIIILLVIASSIFVGLSAVIFSGSLRYFLYKEISYQYLADKITKGAKSDEEKVLRIFTYIHNNLSAAGGQVVDKDSWNDLVRGIGWCDQQSWDFATLLSKENIAARFAMLRDKNGVSPHTIAEVLLKGKWIALDPLNGLVFRENNGSLVTLDEISQNPSLISQNPKVLALPLKERQEFIAWCGTLFPIPMAPKRWASLLEKKNATLPARLTNQAVKYSVRILGEHFVNTYQNLYLSLSRKSFSAPVEYLYFRARNYHIYERASLAENAYKQIIRDCSQSERAEDSRFFLGVLNEEVKQDYRGAIEELNELFKDYPRSKWAQIARYFLGKAYEANGDLENAQVNYGYSASNLDTDAAARLAGLRSSQSR